MTKESVTKVENMEWQDGHYTGEVSDGVPHGKGIMTYPDEGPDNESGRGTYEGEWKEGKQNGQGTLFYPDGTISYVGQWKDGMLYGQGKSISMVGIKVGIFKADGKTTDLS